MRFSIMRLAKPSAAGSSPEAADEDGSGRLGTAAVGGGSSRFPSISESDQRPMRSPVVSRRPVPALPIGVIARLAEFGSC